MFKRGIRSGLGVASLLVALAILVVASADGEGPSDSRPASDPKPLSKEQEDKLKEFGRLNSEIIFHIAERKTEQAIAKLEKALALVQAVYGAEHENVVPVLEFLAGLQEGQEDFAGARQRRAELLGLQKKLHGAADWRVTDARLALKQVELLSSLKARQREQLAKARDEYYLTFLLYREAKWNEAFQGAKNALATHKEILGEKHLLYAESLANLSKVYQAHGDFPDALPLARQALAVRKELLGEKHPLVAESLGVLGKLCKVNGDDAEAETLFRRERDIRKALWGEKHPEYATSLTNLALLYQEQGDYAKAEPLFRQALAIRKESPESILIHILESFIDLAGLYQAQGNYAGAETLLLQARDRCKKAQWEKEPVYGAILNRLTLMYQAKGESLRADLLFLQCLTFPLEVGEKKGLDYAKILNPVAALGYARKDYDSAELLYRKARDILKEALGDKEPDYAASLNNLAVVYQAQGKDAQAKPLYSKARDIFKEALGEKNAEYANILTNLAGLYQAQGNHAEAAPLFRQARDICKEALGEKHPAFANSLNDLALSYYAQGAYAEAEPLVRQALDIDRGYLNLSAFIQSEPQQLSYARLFQGPLDLYLSLVLQDHKDPAPAYAYVLASKSAVLARLRRLHLERQHPELNEDFLGLQTVSQRLAALALSLPKSPRQDWQRRLADLTARKEKLEGNLARRYSAFQKELQQARLGPEQLQASLPEKTALVDFLEYTHFAPPAKGKGNCQTERHLAAFVIQPAKPLELIDLGPVAPIAAAVKQWRQTGCHKGPEAGAELRRLVWDKVEGKLPSATMVLVSPDGVLNGLPLAALPGRKAGNYLLEELGLVMVSVPQQLPELLAVQPPAGPPSLLLVGNVDFGAVPGVASAGHSRSAVRGDQQGQKQDFAPLDVTGAGLLAIKDSFAGRFRNEGQVTTLHKEQATETAFRSQAPKHRFLHLATHGFFAEQAPSASGPMEAGRVIKTMPSGVELFGQLAVTGYHPGLLSGIALAGANRPEQEGNDDGIMTALEIADLDLAGVELVVLPACAAGPAEAGGGEGVLGLQRAFQVAGARSVVTSLWKAPDGPTQALLTRMYDNLWHSKMPLGKLEALREAQLYMLREGKEHGGLTAEDQKGLDSKDKRLPPFYWGAFVLGGDWR